MVYEPVEDEVDDQGQPFYGIQYRKITDLDGILASGNTLLIYFYSSMSGGEELTAGIEDMAQMYNGRFSILMLDAMEYRELMDKYEIDAVPDFVLVKAGQADKVFKSGEYEYWTLNDVVLWLKENGVV